MKEVKYLCKRRCYTTVMVQFYDYWQYVDEDSTMLEYLIEHHSDVYERIETEMRKNDNNLEWCSFNSCGKLLGYKDEIIERLQ